jgi:hypothetical protein
MNFRAAIVLLALTVFAEAKKEVALPDLVEEMKELEHRDGIFRAKLDRRNALRSVHLTGTQGKAEHFRALTGSRSLRALSTGCIRTEALEELSRVLPTLPNLEKLRVISPEAVWPADLFQATGGQRQLRQVSFAYANLPNGALKSLAALPKLEVLHLTNITKFIPADFAELRHCPNLVELNLGNSQMLTDQNLPHLLAIKSLKFLDPGRSKLTPESLAALEARGIEVRNLVKNPRTPPTSWMD